MAQDLVTKPEDAVLYMSRRSGLRLTHTPRYPILGPGGRKVGEDHGVFLSFVDGVLRLAKSGTVTCRDSLGGGDSKMPAEDAHAWLQEHRLFGDVNEGFWRVEQPAPPVSQEEQERMMQAALELDDDTLRGMAEQERSGWGREAIITPCEDAVRKIETVRAQAQADAEAKASAKPAAKPKAAS